MKKLLFLAVTAVAAVSVFAQEAATTDEAAQVERKQESSVWPAFVALSEYPAAPNVIGVRFTIPYSTKQENVTGIDLGFWGRCQNFEGLAVNLIRNDVKDDMAGFQIGLYNSAGRGNGLGLQVGLWNEAACFKGVQAGLVNSVGEAQGLQVGLINVSETLYGYQVGLINIIRDAEYPFFPVINIGF